MDEEKFSYSDESEFDPPPLTKRNEVVHGESMVQSTGPLAKLKARKKLKRNDEDEDMDE